MKIALAQLKLTNEMPENLAKALDAIKSAATNNADLILFPELQLSPFFPQYEHKSADKYLLPIDHSYIQQFQTAAAKYSIMVSPNIYLADGNARYDASLFITAKGKISGISKMVHIMQSSFFYEQDYYTPATDGFKVYDSPFGKIGIVICFDRHLPESIRTCAAKGAELILVPTANTVGEPMEMFEWEMRIQAMQSSVCIAMCNRVGTEDSMEFSGESLVIGPKGDLICKADNREQILYADLFLTDSSALRMENPYFQLRRPDMYV